MRQASTCVRVATDEIQERKNYSTNMLSEKMERDRRELSERIRAKELGELYDYSLGKAAKSKPKNDDDEAGSYKRAKF